MHDEMLREPQPRWSGSEDHRKACGPKGTLESMRFGVARSCEGQEKNLVLKIVIFIERL
jgi:hypothetical protein